MKIYIYKLIDPKTKEIIYIGSTFNIELRLRQHMWSCVKGKSKLSQYIRLNNIVPMIKIIYTVLPTSDHSQRIREAAITEKYYVLKYLVSGHPLMNEKF